MFSQYHWNIVQIKFKCCPNIVSISFRYCSDNIQILSNYYLNIKHCPNAVCNVTRKLCIHLEVCSFLRSIPSPERPPRSLRGQAWFLSVVNGLFHIMNLVCMSPESSVSTLKTLAYLVVLNLLGVSRASSKESRRTWLVPNCSL